MNLIRLIVIGLIVWLLYRLLQRILSKQSTRTEAPRGIARDMVKCAHCGIHIPADEALCHDGTCYCCMEHRNAGPDHTGK